MCFKTSLISLSHALAGARFRCYNASEIMADWKQITARIRRARTGKDPAGQLSSLYEKTRDAMVAFELARLFETSGQNSEAAKWYLVAAERFRRADWKSKAQEAAVRLGAELSQDAAEADSTTPEQPASLTVPPELAPGEKVASPASVTSPISAESAAQPTAAEAPGKPRRHRGRRGGRNRRRGEGKAEKRVSESQPSDRRMTSASPESQEPQPPRKAHARSIPTLPVEPVTDAGVQAVRGRSGDPGLSSRLSALEMQLRRLLTCPPVTLNEADRAPAGPGVFVLTDSDLTSYYYVEACQTLRIAVGSLLRSGASRRGSESINIKPRLAEHLGIPESRVTKYLADHCVVRWLQLDEGASHFAHFAVAVLRPNLNE